MRDFLEELRDVLGGLWLVALPIVITGTGLLLWVWAAGGGAAP
jgi:hypothetical protein